jgi:CheY-like chemotaxis protein
MGDSIRAGFHSYLNLNILTMNNNPIVIIDDDADDVELFRQAFRELQVENEIIVFKDGLEFLDFINTLDKKSFFFILCDINMNNISGLELKQELYDNEKWRIECIPFLFFSTSETPLTINKAYSLNVQGYFVKPNSIDELKDMFDAMIKYWGYSEHPIS